MWSESPRRGHELILLLPVACAGRTLLSDAVGVEVVPESELECLTCEYRAICVLPAFVGQECPTHTRLLRLNQSYRCGVTAEGSGSWGLCPRPCPRWDAVIW